MQYQCAVQGYRRRRDTNAYYTAMYLLTSNDDIYRRTANCFCKDGIEFGYAVLKNTSPHNYALFMAARDLCDKTEAVTMADLAETLKELELAGYIIRRQLRGKDGRISDTEYTIFEKPRKPSPPDTTLPDTENPYLDNPDTEASDTDNPAQLNTKKSNTQKSNTDLSSTHSFFLPAADGMTDGFEKKAEIREQIEYDILCQQYDRMQLDELVEIMLEVAMNRSPTVKIGRDAEYPTGFVQQRFEKITSMHIEKVMDGIRENTTRVWNTKAYLMAALFNSVSTIDNHYAMLVNHDFHGGP